MALARYQLIIKLYFVNEVIIKFLLYKNLIIFLVGWWLVVGGWWLVVGGWWLVVGGWWLVVGGWWLVVGN